MSNVKTRCGIYSISTPHGTRYVGSSCAIERRWHEHRSALKHGKHASERLQAAYVKHGLVGLRFDVIEECLREMLNEREQHHIDELRPRLNTTLFVANVWLNPETRAKLAKIHASSEWSAARAKIARESSTRWVSVDCDDGRRFKNLADAARAFDVGIPHIKHLLESGRAGRLGVRFKLSGDEWKAPPPRAPRLRATKETRQKMSDSKLGIPPSAACLAAAAIANRLRKGEKRKYQPRPWQKAGGAR